MKDMNELMLHFLQDMYYAEKLGVRSMAKTIKAVENEELKEALQEHREQSRDQIERLAKVFEALGKKPRAKTCAAMDGLSEEGEEAISEGEKGPVLDAALIACAQAAEHYEIARYGAMAAWAKTMGLDEAAEILEGILQEEKDADARLSEIAERALNQEASQEGDDDEDEDEDEDEDDDDDGDEVSGEEGEEEPAPVEKPKRKAPARAKR